MTRGQDASAVVKREENQLSLKQRRGNALKNLLLALLCVFFVEFSVRIAVECFLLSGQRAQRGFALIIIIIFFNP